MFYTNNDLLNVDSNTTVTANGWHPVLQPARWRISRYCYRQQSTFDTQIIVLW